MNNGPEVRGRDKHLESLLDLFHENITISSEAVDCKYSPVSPERNALARCECIASYIQSEDLGGVASLDAVTLALAGVAGDDSKVSACDSEDRAAIFGIWVKLPLLRVCNSGHVWHGGDYIRGGGKGGKE